MNIASHTGKNTRIVSQRQKHSTDMTSKNYRKVHIECSLIPFLEYICKYPLWRRQRLYLSLSFLVTFEFPLLLFMAPYPVMERLYEHEKSKSCYQFAHNDRLVIGVLMESIIIVAQRKTHLFFELLKVQNHLKHPRLELITWRLNTKCRGDWLICIKGLFPSPACKVRYPWVS